MEMTKYINEALMTHRLYEHKVRPESICLPHPKYIRKAILKRYKNPTAEQIKKMTLAIVGDFCQRYDTAKLISFRKDLETKIENKNEVLNAEQIQLLINVDLLVDSYFEETSAVNRSEVSLYAFREHIGNLTEDKRIIRVARDEVCEYLGQVTFQSETEIDEPRGILKEALAVTVLDVVK